MKHMGKKNSGALRGRLVGQEICIYFYFGSTRDVSISSSLLIIKI